MGGNARASRLREEPLERKCTSEFTSACVILSRAFSRQHSAFSAFTLIADRWPWQFLAGCWPL